MTIGLFKSINETFIILIYFCISYRAGLDSSLQRPSAPPQQVTSTVQNHLVESKSTCTQKDLAVFNKDAKDFIALQWNSFTMSLFISLLVCVLCVCVHFFWVACLSVCACTVSHVWGNLTMKWFKSHWNTNKRNKREMESIHKLNIYKDTQLRELHVISWREVMENLKTFIWF